MAVDNHGIECIKLAAEQVVPGSDSDYLLKTKLLDYDNKELNLETNSTNQLKVVLDGRVDDTNSSSTILAAGETFTGSSVNTLDYAIFFVTIFSDQESDIDGLCVEVSSDELVWRDGDCFTVPANTEKTFSFQPNKQFMRIRYKNGSTDQTVFDLQTILKKTNSKPSSHRISESIVSDDDATLSKTVLTGENPAGIFVNFKATTAGNFKMSLEELENQISVNSNSQLKVTQYDSLGNEGQKIIGLDYLSGNSGIDASTESMQIVDYEHHEIHEGRHFNYCDYALGESNGAEIEFFISAPNTTRWTHFAFEISASDGATIELFEGPSGVTGGTSIIPRNNNRNSSNTSGMTILKDPSAIVSDGAREAGFLAGGGKTAGAKERNNEIVLRQNETYLIRITSLGVSNDISWCGEWYEHIDKN